MFDAKALPHGRATDTFYANTPKGKIRLLEGEQKNDEQENTKRNSPTKLAHIVYRTRRFEQMMEWYKTVFDARIQWQNSYREMSIGAELFLAISYPFFRLIENRKNHG